MRSATANKSFPGWSEVPACPKTTDLPSDLQHLTDYDFQELSEARWRFDFARLLHRLKQFGLTPPARVAFPEIRQQARVEARDAWLTADDLESVRANVEAFLPAALE
jgi:hypothetical protein